MYLERSEPTITNDPHHCTCFSIPKSHFLEFKIKLEGYGFKQPLFEENRGQIIGLTKRLSECYQIHVKLMPSGNIEAEIEYTSDYPFAHLNPVHSYSAHDEVKELLNMLRIKHTSKIFPPLTCRRPKIIEAQKPTHKDTVLVMGGIAVAADLFLNNGKITKKILKALFE